MNHISLENYLILTVENGQIEVLYDAQATDLYLYKAENYYLTRNKSHIISACLSENILLIKSGRKTDIVNTPFFKNLHLDSYIIFKQMNPELYELCSDKHECNIARMLLNIFEVDLS